MKVEELMCSDSSLGGALAGAMVGGLVGSPKWPRILSIVLESKMAATTFRSPLQFGQVEISISKTRFKSLGFVPHRKPFAPA